MSKKNKIRHTVLTQKILYTAVILLLYLIGRSMPLYGIDISAYKDQAMDTQMLLMQTISGDRYQNSMLALGISPYMISTLVVQMVMTCMSNDRKAHILPSTINKMSLLLMLAMAVYQAINHLGELNFRYTGIMLNVSKVIACTEMIAGAFVILWMTQRNKKYGIGGQTALIFVNVLDGLAFTLHGHEISQLLVPIIVCLFVVIIVITMELAEKRIPVQRISIHNIYADKNYMSIKLNPIGVMPIMFSSAFFMLIQMLLQSVVKICKGPSFMIDFLDKFALTEPVGILVYMGVLYFLTITFSIIFLSPKDLTEQFLKSGDSILNLHAGKDTKRYLYKGIITLSLISATVMSLCIGIPMFLQFTGAVETSLVMLPSSIMMLTGLLCNIYQEVIAVKNYDEYQPFL